jgi:hypothetical protein
MNYKFHILLGIVSSILLHFLLPGLNSLNILILFFSSFLIDIDHYLYYVYKKKNLNPYKAYKWFKKNIRKFHFSLNKEQQKKTYVGIYLFHGIESLIILFLLGNYFSFLFFFVLIGFIFHLSIDLIYEKILHQRLDKFSFIYNCISFKKFIFIEEI